MVETGLADDLSNSQTRKLLVYVRLIGLLEHENTYNLTSGLISLFYFLR